MTVRVTVCGLWHLGSVTAACVAEHFPTLGYDPDVATVSGLLSGRPPVFEPGLAELIREGLSRGKLRFSDDLKSVLGGSEVVWVTFDTPVNADDVADVEFVERQVLTLFPHLSDGTMVLISSQVPAGFTARIEAAFRSAHSGREVSFAYSPENLRLGKALDAFRSPERVVVGVRREADRTRLASLFGPFCGRLEWMSVESAEMTKHALNAFLATSIAFINEIALLCEKVGADAKEVERGLKSDRRIGPKAYLAPGAAFTGGTLARDVAFLNDFGRHSGTQTPLLNGVRESNDRHKGWARRKLKELLGDLSGKTVAVLGLTYKSGTDTLRRSGAVEFCLWLAQEGARVQAYDPIVNQLPSELSQYINLRATVHDALQQADTLVVATECPDFTGLSADELRQNMRRPIVLDPNRFLNPSLGYDDRVRYAAVGHPRDA